MKLILLKYLKKILYLFFLLSVCLVILECSFRYQLIDFYSSELNGLNTEKQLGKSSNNVLIFGDSFTAHPNSYVNTLRAKYPSYNFINSAIPGTGIKQHELLFKKRIKQFKPKSIIYQFYVGNDFSDIEHPINFKEVSFLKNIFWKVSEKILFLQYLNFKLAFLNSKNQKIESLQETKFSTFHYNNRVKNYYKANPSSLNNTILLFDKDIKNTYKLWKTKIGSLYKLVEDSTPVYLVIVPHNAQINATYMKRNIKLGASLSEEIMHPKYNLVESIESDFKSWKIINPLPMFQKLDNLDSLYYENDPHLTSLGQLELGKIIATQFND